MTHQRTREERRQLGLGQPLGGSTSRSPEDPRGRRGAQSEQELSQRFHADHFYADRGQRLRLRDQSLNDFTIPTTDLAVGAGLGPNDFNKITNLKDPTAAQDAATKAYVDTSGSQVVCVESPGDGTSVGGASSYATLPLNAATSSVGTYITVDTAGDHISLSGQHVYLVSVEVLFFNTYSPHWRNGYVRIQSTGGTVYAARGVDIRSYQEAAVTVTAVVDLSSSDGLDIEVQYYGEGGQMWAWSAWITVQGLA